MRTLVFCCGLASLLLSASLAQGDPWNDKEIVREKNLPPYDHGSYTKTFEGGRRSVVIATGGWTSFLGVYVYDSHGNCVARDDSISLNVRDDMAAEWIPPQRGVYTIEVHNLGRQENTFLVAVRQDKTP